MCSNPCESELTCFRPESNRGHYGLLNFSSASLSTTELWWQMNHQKSFRILLSLVNCHYYFQQSVWFPNKEPGGWGPFLFFFLGWRMPKKITGLSRCWAPCYPCSTLETVPEPTVANFSLRPTLQVGKTVHIVCGLACILRLTSPHNQVSLTTNKWSA